LAQHGRVVDVVVDQQPGLGEAAVGDELQRLTGSGGAILDLIEAANEDAAEIDQAFLQPLPGFALLRPRSVEPPDARVVVLRLVGIFAGKRGLADAAEAMHGGRLRDGSGVARL
jgi:hypothetical protein